MRPITWLHLSDVHLRPHDTWPQNVVLDAMCADIAGRCATLPPDFVLFSGDLAFSGKPEEYEVVAVFLDALSSASGVPKTHIYCVPGNHDINRNCQRMAFTGARAVLNDQNGIDTLLGPSSRAELETLLQREAHYRAFQASYFASQERTPTEDRLAYVAHVVIEDVRLAIIGLDSAWLAEGGIEDHGKLLIGERQVANALTLAHRDTEPPHVLLAMSHHPLEVLQQFDLRPVQARIQRSCHLLHCGHLHEPDQRPIGHGPDGCVTLVAGSSFETRHTRNSYAMVTLDLLRAVRSIVTVQYNCHRVAFTPCSPVEFPIAIQRASTCRLQDLATAIVNFDPGLAESWPHYLAALLLDQKADVPVPTGVDYVFASLSVLEAGPDSDLKARATAFSAFRNALRVLYPDLPLLRILQLHGAPVTKFGATLMALSESQSTLRTRLNALEADARGLGATEQPGSLSRTVAMLQEIANAGDWELLRQQARRHSDSPVQSIAMAAQRALALALSNSDERADREVAVSLYTRLTESDGSDRTDFGNLAVLLMDLRAWERAKEVILSGLATCGTAATAYFLELGHQIAAETGDRTFRRTLDMAIAESNRE